MKKDVVHHVDTENVSSVLQEIQDAFFDIPFENSDFQTQNFVIAAQITPERAYRQLGLRITNRLNALRTAKYSKMRNQILIEEKTQMINDPNVNVFEKRRLQIDLLEMKESEKYTDKLINDAIHECNLLYGLFKKFPKYNREQFEMGEENHYLERTKRQVLGIEGSKESLYNIMHDKKEIFNAIDLLEKSNEEDYIRITMAMKNRIQIQEDNIDEISYKKEN